MRLLVVIYMEKIVLFGANKNVDYEDINSVANSILNNYVLVVNDVKHRLCEIEIYLNSTTHKDKYVHCNEAQKLYGKWYFHAYPNGSYKGGTYKGLDLTLGCDEQNIYYGILIRSIADLNLGNRIEGPCNVVNYILKAYGYETVADYMATKNVKYLSANCKQHFYLKKQNLKIEKIYVAPRIGLSAKYPAYKTKLYRYVIDKTHVKKEKSKLIELINV